jgi:hypothetical protein
VDWGGRRARAVGEWRIFTNWWRVNEMAEGGRERGKGCEISEMERPFPEVEGNAKLIWGGQDNNRTLKSLWGTHLLVLFTVTDRRAR